MSSDDEDDEEAFEGTLVGCPDCKGYTQGEAGPVPCNCETCGGTGLVSEEEVEKSL